MKKIIKVQQGVILVIVLIFLLVLSMLAITALGISHLQLQMGQNYAMTIKAFEAAEAGLQMGEKNLKSSRFDFEQYSVIYEVEQMPGNSCLLPQHQLGIFYRITAEAKRLDEQPVMLQSTYAQPTTKPCSGHERVLNFGRMSWRQLL